MSLNAMKFDWSVTVRTGLLLDGWERRTDKMRNNSIYFLKSCFHLAFFLVSCLKSKRNKKKSMISLLAD